MAKFRLPLALLVLLTALAGWQLFNDFTRLQSEGGPSNLAPASWFATGPLSFFLATALGLLFSLTVVFTRDQVISRFWKTALWFPFVWLALGACACTALDLFVRKSALSPWQHLQSVALVTLPMLLAAACLLQLRGTPYPTRLLTQAGAAWRTSLSIGAKIAASLALLATCLFTVTASALLLLMASCTPPKLTTLAQRFPAQQADLERVVAMSDQDAQMSVIDPSWLSTTGGQRAPIGSDGLIGISAQRWDDYRRIFRRIGLTQGIRRYGPVPGGDAFLIVRSIGMLDNGYSHGYVHCGSGTQHAYPPCTSTESQVQHGVDAQGESYSFIRLAPGWYAYSDGAN